jgi:hypothetical protein
MGDPEEGTTDENGGLDVNVPVHVREIDVTFPTSGAVYPMSIGEMDPVDESSGVRKRLQNLGYYLFSPGDDVDAADARAILAFQRAHGLPPTGAMDDATKATLAKDHGS